MLKDDQMMTMITVLAVILGAGMLIERSGVLSSNAPGENERWVLVADAAIAHADEPTVIDVLENDIGVADGDADGLIVVERPGCGTAIAREGKVRYVPADGCPRSQTFSYGVLGRGHGLGPGKSGGQTGEVVVTLRFDDPPQLEAAAVLTESGMSGMSAPAASAQVSVPAPATLASGAVPGGASNPVASLAPPMPATPSFADLAPPTYDPDTVLGSLAPGVADLGSYPAPAIAALEASLAGATRVAAGDPLPAAEHEQVAPVMSIEPSPAPRS